MKYLEVTYMDGKTEEFQATVKESVSFLKVIETNGNQFSIPISNIRRYRIIEKNKSIQEFKPRDYVDTLVNNCWIDGMIIDIDSTDITVAITDERYMNYASSGNDFKIITVNKDSNDIRKKQKVMNIWKDKKK